MYLNRRQWEMQKVTSRANKILIKFYFTRGA